MRNITTTTPAAMLPSMTATRAAIMTTAAARHVNTTSGIITMPAFTSSNTAAAEESARVGHLAAHLALRARHQSSGLQLMLELDRAQGLDHQREDLPRIAAEALAARAEHLRHRTTADALQAIADRISTPAAQAATAAQAAASERKAAAAALDHAQRLESVIGSTSHTDRADISQAAALVYWTTGNFTAACSAAGKAIGAIAAAQGCNATRTKVIPISREEAAAELAAHPNTSTYDPATGEHLDAPCRIPFNVKGGNATTAGFYTIEHRNSKRYPAGWYRVNHYYTAAPYISYEVFASDEDAPQLATNGGINLITDEADAIDLATLFDRANLSERERLVLRYMLDNTAAAAGIAAVAEYQQQTAERIATAPDRKAAQRIQRDADKQTDDIRAAAIRRNAMTRAGIYSDANQRKTLQRIRDKLASAKRDPQPLTAAELDERSRRDWERMQSNRSRYSHRPAAAPAPVIVPRVTVCVDTSSGMRPTEYADYNVQFVERINPADLRPVERVTTRPTAAAVLEALPTVRRMSEDDYRRMFDTCDLLRVTMRDLPRDYHYAQITAERAARFTRFAEQDESRAAYTARAAAAYAKEDKSPAAEGVRAVARLDRTKANETRRYAADAQRKAAEAADAVRHAETYIAATLIRHVDLISTADATAAKA